MKKLIAILTVLLMMTGCSIGGFGSDLRKDPLNGTWVLDDYYVKTGDSNALLDGMINLVAKQLDDYIMPNLQGSRATFNNDGTGKLIVRIDDDDNGQLFYEAEVKLSYDSRKKVIRVSSSILDIVGWLVNIPETYEDLIDFNYTITDGELVMSMADPKQSSDNIHLHLVKDGSVRGFNREEVYHMTTDLNELTFIYDRTIKGTDLHLYDDGYGYLDFIYDVGYGLTRHELMYVYLDGDYGVYDEDEYLGEYQIDQNSVVMLLWNNYELVFEK